MSNSLYDTMKNDLEKEKPISEDLCPKCQHILAGHGIHKPSGKTICFYETDELIQCGCVQ